MEILEGATRNTVMYYQDGYIYYKDKCLHNTLYLRCRETTCFGTAKVVDNILTHMSVHNHTHQDEEREKLLLMTRLKDAAENETTSLKDIIMRETSENPVIMQDVRMKTLLATLHKRRRIAQEGYERDGRKANEGAGFLTYSHKEKRNRRNATTKREIKKRKHCDNKTSEENNTSSTIGKQHATHIPDDELMIESCTALIRLLFGEANWYRWQKLREQTQLPNFQAFLSWMLDVTERQYNEDTYFSSGTCDLSAASETENSSSIRNAEENSEAVIFDRNDVHPSEEVDVSQPVVGQASTSSDGWNPSIVNFLQHPNQKSFLCQECKVPIQDLDMIGEHVNFKHLSSVINISCSCCFESFSSTQAYSDFHKAQSILQNTNFVCEYCSVSFPSLTLLQEHIATVHGNNVKYPVCSKCEKKFSSKDSFIIHQARCLGFINPPMLGQ